MLQCTEKSKKVYKMIRKSARCVIQRFGWWSTGLLHWTHIRDYVVGVGLCTRDMNSSESQAVLAMRVLCRVESGRFIWYHCSPLPHTFLMGFLFIRPSQFNIMVFILSHCLFLWLSPPPKFFHSCFFPLFSAQIMNHKFYLPLTLQSSFHPCVAFLLWNLPLFERVLLIRPFSCFNEHPFCTILHGSGRRGGPLSSAMPF